MRTRTVLTTGVWVLLSAGVLQGQTVATTSTQISRQQIAAVLREKLEGAPQETGGGLLDGDHFRMGALKRRLPGAVEVHREDTDVMYVLSGSATLVTGGAVVGEHEISAKEERGTAIRNGVRHRLHAGDVVVIPKNQAHWFQNVSGEVSYIVIKVQ